MRKFRIMSACVLAMTALLFLGTSLRAERATVQEMDNVCNNWLSYYVNYKGTWDKSASPQVTAVTDISREGQFLGRCYSIDPIGFIVVPSLKELPPIKAYSMKCNLDLDAPEGIGALLKDVLANRLENYESYYGSLDAVQSNKSEAMFDPKNHHAWDEFDINPAEFKLALAEKAAAAITSVGPLLETAWHQGGPYNYYCPMGDGGLCVVGCVATAAAQIQWYHQWPPAGFNGRKYLWEGDNSCNGATPPMMLAANFSDTYEYTWSVHNLAEISEEMGIAFSMMYGRCGSGAYTSGSRGIYASYYGYQNIIQEYIRSDFLPFQWFDTLRADIDQGLPVLYTIYSHCIVADGWQTAEDLSYYHFNYGWGGQQTAWYAMDNLYCPWDGCTFMIERMYNHIIPDKEIMFYADTISGHVPLDIQFTGMSDRNVSSWQWDFGDGSTSTDQSPSHTYTKAGCFDVTLTINHDQGSRTMTRTSFIYAIKDSLMVGTSKAEPGQTVEVDISARNSEPLSQIIIPVEYGGDATLVYDSFSTAGCRTASFEKKTLKHSDVYNSRLTISLQARLEADSWTEDLAPGSGPILKVFFTVPSGVDQGMSSDILVDGYSTYMPTFYGNIYSTIYSYGVSATDGAVKTDLICGDANDDDDCNLLDILYLIDAVYNGGSEPTPFEAGDVNMDSSINLLDILGLIDYIYNKPSTLDCLLH